jgi:hypothetical protein
MEYKLDTLVEELTFAVLGNFEDLEVDELGNGKCG